MNKVALQLLLSLYFTIFSFAVSIYSQEESRPEMTAAPISGTIKLDGILNEPDWGKAPINDHFKTIEPVEGGVPSGRTQVRVLAHPRFLLIGVECFDDNPEEIVNFSALMPESTGFSTPREISFLLLIIIRLVEWTDGRWSISRFC